MTRILVYAAAAQVFCICLYAFLQGNRVFAGQFENDALAWYFLAKGVFCATSLLLTQGLLDAIRKLQK